MTTAPSRRRALTPGRRAWSDVVLTRLVNPVVCTLLRSPLHDLLSDGVALLEYTGRRSGRSLAVPVNYLLEDDDIVVVTRRRRRWWRNFRDAAPLELRLRGRHCLGHAVVSSASPQEITDVLERLYARAGHPLAAGRAVRMAADRVVLHVHVEQVDPEMPTLRGRRLWRRWTGAVAVGEAAGFCVPAVAGAGLAALEAPLPVLAPVVLMAGVAEGAILGAAQAVALRRALPAVRSRRWIAATVKGALVAWSIGLVPFAVDLEQVGTPVLIVVGVPLGALLLVAMGAFQARELRGHAVGPGRWIVATAAAWAAGLVAFTAVTSPLWHDGQGPVVVAGIGVLGGLAMALTAAATTGVALVRLTSRIPARMNCQGASGRPRPPFTEADYGQADPP